jgi:hypothetical protein
LPARSAEEAGQDGLRATVGPQDMMDRALSILTNRRGG